MSKIKTRVIKNYLTLFKLIFFKNTFILRFIINFEYYYNLNTFNLLAFIFKKI
jgi:hypothetical protein